jgi:divalent metal cation (Fe/Co/Zn/Cd) transporter
LILGGTATWLAYETKGLLIGESANLRVVKEIRAIVGALPQVEHVNEVLTMHMGPEFILANLSVDFKDDLSAVEVEAAISSMDVQIKQACPDVQRVFIEAEARKINIREGERGEG